MEYTLNLYFPGGRKRIYAENKENIRVENVDFIPPLNSRIRIGETLCNDSSAWGNYVVFNQIVEPVCKVIKKPTTLDEKTLILSNQFITVEAKRVK